MDPDQLASSVYIYLISYYFKSYLSIFRAKLSFLCIICSLRQVKLSLDKYLMSQCMRFPTMWYMRAAKAQISLRIRAV